MDPFYTWKGIKFVHNYVKPEFAFQLLFFFCQTPRFIVPSSKETEANLGSISNFRVNTSCFFTPKEVNICCYLCHTLQLLFGTPTEKYIAPLTHTLSTYVWRYYNLFAQCKRQMFSVDHCTKHSCFLSWLHLHKCNLSCFHRVAHNL